MGSVEHLTPTQEVRSVRFLGDWAYVNTFRRVDPLLTIDLADPANPRLRGMIDIPGFSNYLHPVGEEFLIGIGRDGDGANGIAGVPQVSLFYVGDRDNPRLVDRLTMHGVTHTSSEAFEDHHAVAYFAGHGVLSIPIHWQNQNGQMQSAAWAFQVEVDPAAGDGRLEPAARMDHDSSVRRSLRIGNGLITVSGTMLNVHDIGSFEALGSVYLGRLVSDDSFTISEDAGATILDVLANDHLPDDARIASVEPVNANGNGGTVEIAADGRSVVYTPAANFTGYWQFRYTVVDAVRGPQQATVTVIVEGVPDPPQAVDDEFNVQMDERQVVLDVLANDRDIDGEHIGGLVQHGGATRIFFAIALNAVLPPIGADLDGDGAADWEPFYVPVLRVPGFGGLKIVDVTAPSQGGTVETGFEGSRLFYTPASGFSGIETFRYTVQAASGLTAEATVTVRVAPPPANEPNANVGDGQERMRVRVERNRPPGRDRQTTRPATAGGMRATRTAVTGGASARANRSGGSIEGRRLTTRSVRRERLHDAALVALGE